PYHRRDPGSGGLARVLPARRVGTASRRKSMTRADLGARVRTSDGQEVGVVDKLIFDPATERVKAVAIRRGFILHRDVEVPIEDLRAGPGDELLLSRSADQ